MWVWTYALHVLQIHYYTWNLRLRWKLTQFSINSALSIYLFNYLLSMCCDFWFLNIFFIIQFCYFILLLLFHDAYLYNSTASTLCLIFVYFRACLSVYLFSCSEFSRWFCPCIIAVVWMRTYCWPGKLRIGSKHAAIYPHHPPTHIQTYWAIRVSRHTCKSRNWLSAPFSPPFWNIPTTRPGEFNPVQQRDKRRTEWKAVSTRRTKDHRKPGTHRYIWGGFEAAPSRCYYCWFVSILFRVQTTLTSPRYWFPRELFYLLIKSKGWSISATAAPNIPRMQQKQTGTINIAGFYQRPTSVTSRYAAFCPMQIGIDAYSTII